MHDISSMAYLEKRRDINSKYYMEFLVLMREKLRIKKFTALFKHSTEYSGIRKKFGTLEEIHSSLF